MPSNVQMYFYDEQIRRFLLQFTRLVSNFQVEYGRDEDNPDQMALLRVPVRYGDATRNAQTIIQQNSANMMPATPLMTFYISALEYARDRVQEPYFISKMHVRQRTYDSATETYETTQGNAFTVERYMPAPYNLQLKLDIWTSNTHTKFQIIEQMLPLFNPSLEIQSTDNFIDWTSLSVVYLDRFDFSSRTIPIGTENPIDIASCTFSMPIWLSLPVKVKKLGVVERIVMSVYDSQGDLNDAITNNDLLMGTRQKITPYNYAVVLIGNQIQIMKQKYADTQEPDNDSLAAPELVSDSKLLWPAVIGMYGTLRPGISQIRLEQPDETEVIGTIVVDPNDERLLLFTVDEDTIPSNTLDAIDAVIDPQVSGPNYGLPAATTGQRYLLTEGTGATTNDYPAVAWVGDSGRTLIAQANDIVEYTGNFWRVVFSAAAQSDTQYVTNITTGIQYKWTGQEWIKSYQGVYLGGQWRLVL